jgi:hypothetical protein
VSAPDLLRRVVTALDEAGVPYMLVGSFASMSHGAPRATQDIDIVIDPTPESLDRFLAGQESGGLYVSPSAREALANRDQFNLIESTTAWKVDLIVRKDRPFSLTEFARRTPVRVFGVDLYLATAEDTVLSKLEWAAMGQSDRQIADAATVLEVRGDELDHEYLERWAAELGVTELLERARGG